MIWVEAAVDETIRRFGPFSDLAGAEACVQALAGRVNVQEAIINNQQGTPIHRRDFANVSAGYKTRAYKTICRCLQGRELAKTWESVAMTSKSELLEQMYCGESTLKAIVDVCREHGIELKP